MKKKLFTIDIHTHILPKDIPDFNKRFGYESIFVLNAYKGAPMIKLHNEAFT